MTAGRQSNFNVSKSSGLGGRMDRCMPTAFECCLTIPIHSLEIPSANLSSQIEKASLLCSVSHKGMLGFDARGVAVEREGMSLSQQQSVGSSAARVDDYALMASIRSRDSRAFAALYDRYSSTVYGLCLRALHDPRDAEDLLIDIFSEIWERGDRFDPTRGSPVGYVMGLSRSRLVDRLRSRRSAAQAGLSGAAGVESASNLQGADPGPLDSAMDAEQRLKVTAAMGMLTPDQRQALELAYFDALSHTEVAAPWASRWGP